MTEPITSATISKWIILTLWSALGGITHALVEKRKGGVKDLLDGFILALISGFAGLMWGLVAIKFYPNDVIMVSFASGLGGFMSLEGLAIMATYIKNKFYVK
jgi:hypothetical protein